MAVPIAFGGETWGQIWAARRADQQPFSERDARFLHAISGQVGSAIGRAEVFSRVSELAHSDGLTGLANRRAFDEALELAVLEARRTGHDLALLLCDMDNLKDINDHHGHEAGDAALRTVAEALTQVGGRRPGLARLPRRRRRVRDRPAPLRRERGREVAESILRRLRSSHPPVGVSCGVAMLRAGEGRPADLLRAADAAQYAAKRGGRGRVFVAGPERRRRGVRGPARRPRAAAARCATRRRSTSAGSSRRSSACWTARSRARRPPSAWAACCAASPRRPTPSAGPSPSPRSAREPESLVVGGRPGNVTAMARHGAWLDGRDLLALRMASAGSGAGCLVVDRADAHLSGLLRECMMRTSLDTLLVHTISSLAAARGSRRSAATRARATCARSSRCCACSSRRRCAACATPAPSAPRHSPGRRLTPPPLSRAAATSRSAPVSTS